MGIFTKDAADQGEALANVAKEAYAGGDSVHLCTLAGPSKIISGLDPADVSKILSSVAAVGWRPLNCSFPLRTEGHTVKRTILLLAITAALIGTTAATAATITDLPGLGYTVGVAGDYPAGCTTYSVSAPWGYSGYITLCTDPAVQASVNPDGPSAVNSLANPVGLCNAKWQWQHPDQLAAFQSISGKGWGLSGDQCADSYTVSNPNDSTVAYSGSGSGLPGFDQSHGNPPAAQGPPPPNGTTTPPPSNCLPLCPNPGDTRGGGGVLISAPIIVAATAAVTGSPSNVAPPADAAPVDLTQYTVVPSTDAELAVNPDVIGWLNTPYVTTPLLAPAA